VIAESPTAESRALKVVARPGGACVRIWIRAGAPKYESPSSSILPDSNVSI
jgi:hypothetical protein